MIEPVRITGDAGRLRIANLHDFRDLSHLVFPWTLEEEGAPVAEGVLDVAAVRAGETAEVALPELPATQRRGVADRAGGARRRRAVGARRPRGRLGPARR